MKKLIFGLIGVVLIVSAVLFFTNRPIMNQDPLTNNSSNTNNSNTPSPTTGTTRVNMDMTSWKTYRSDDLAVEFKYPSEWSLEGGVSLNAECFGTTDKGNIVSIGIHLPTQGGLFVEGVNKQECTNKGLGYLHYAKNVSEIKYKESSKIGTNIFYLDFGRVNPGTHAFHAYLFGNLKAVPSLHFYYNPMTLDGNKEYVGNEAEYQTEKDVFTKILSTVKILD